MNKPDTLETFKAKHPFPDGAGISKLYKYFRFDDEHPEYLSNLLIGNKLYHSLPENFNDPFECKPHWSWPEQPKKIAAIRERLNSVARNNGMNRKEAEQFATKCFSDKEEFAKQLKRIVAKNYRDNRICSFTTSKENILLWSHYGDSHRGLCVEFDATLLPISSAMKVHYQDEYPAIEYPLPQDARGFAAMLIKAKAWEYENEFRSFLIPIAPQQHPNDRESFLLSGNEITGIYLGAEISEKHKEQVMKLAQGTNQAKRIYQAELSKSAFALEFRLLDV